MDVSTLLEPALLRGFFFRLFLLRIEMGLRARLDAMESQSTAQQWKRQRFLRAKSGLASLCSADGSMPHSSEACRIILEDDYYKQKERLNLFTLSSKSQRSANPSKTGFSRPRFLRDEASPFDPLGILRVGSHPHDGAHSLSDSDDRHLQSFQLNDDSHSLEIPSRLHRQADSHPNSRKYSVVAIPVDMRQSRGSDSRKDFSAAATLVDMQSAISEKSCPKDFSAAAALVDMHGARPEYRVAAEGANIRLISCEPNSYIDKVAAMSEKTATGNSAAAAVLDTIVSKPQHCVAIGATNIFSNSGGDVLSQGELQVHRRASEALETQYQGVPKVSASLKVLSAPNMVGELVGEPLYKQLLERRRTDDLHFKDLNTEIQAKEVLWENLQRTRHALFKLRRREAAKTPMPAAFNPLSEEEELEVQYALNGANRQELLVQHQPSNIDLSRGALQCLKPGAWLNDEVINLYMELLKERECREQSIHLKCHFFNTFFFNKLYKDASSYDYKAVRRWTTQKKLGYSLLECDKIFVPIHKDIHWCLAVINLRENKLQYLDSLKGKDLNALQALARYIRDEAKDKGAQAVDTSNWKLDCPPDIPEQMNGCDCGMFMIKYADFLSQGDDLKFTQENMEYFRKRTVLELLQLKASKS